MANPQLEEIARLRGDAMAVDAFTAENLPFIEDQLVESGALADERTMGIAMFCFYEAVKSYQKNDGDFYEFAAGKIREGLKAHDDPSLLPRRGYAPREIEQEVQTLKKALGQQGIAFAALIDEPWPDAQALSDLKAQAKEAIQGGGQQDARLVKRYPLYAKAFLLLYTQRLQNLQLALEADGGEGYIILENHESFSVALASGGLFVPVANLSYRQGQAVSRAVPGAQRQGEAKSGLPLIIGAAIAAALCIALALFFIFANRQEAYASAYFSAGAELTLSVAESGELTELKGDNAGGETLASGYEWKGKTLYEAFKYLVNAAYAQGFMQEGTQAVLSIQAPDALWLSDAIAKAKEAVLLESQYYDIQVLAFGEEPQSPSPPAQSESPVASQNPTPTLSPTPTPSDEGGASPGASVSPTPTLSPTAGLSPSPSQSISPSPSQLVSSSGTVFDVETSGGNTQLTGNISTSMENRVIELVNEARAEAGLPALSYDSSLTGFARQRAVEYTFTFSHTRPNGSEWSTISSDINGENLAYGQESAGQAFDDWMNSTGHKENILRPEFKRIAVGCVEINGVYTWAQLFGQ